MKILNTSNRLICVNTAKGRIDLIPGVVTDNKRFDKLKGNDKIFDHYLKEGIFKVVKTESKESKKTAKELLQDEAEALGIDTTDLTKAQLTDAIAEAKK